jgi:cyclase
MKMPAEALAILAGLTALATSPAAAQDAFTHMSGAGRDIRRIELGPGIYQFMTMRDSYVRQLNSIVIINAQDVLVFDTNTRPSSARRILREIRRLTNKPIRFVVNSHGHPDHWSGNEVYHLAFPQAEIVATRRTAELMRQNVGLWVPRFTAQLAAMRRTTDEEVRTGRRADDSPATPEQIRQDRADVADYASFLEETRSLHRIFPTLTFDGSMSLDHGGREFWFMSVMGDQEATTILYLPREGLLLTGDAVSYPMPYVSHPRAHIETLRMLAGLLARTIVPGHGPAFHDNGFLDLERQFFEAVAEEVEAAQHRGISGVEALQAAVTGGDVRERLAHGDADLEARFTARVRDIVAEVVADQASAPGR